MSYSSSTQNKERNVLVPRRKFKPLTLGNLPRVMVAILAMSEEDREALAVQFNSAWLPGWQRSNLGVSHPHGGNELALLFDAVLQTRKAARQAFVPGLSYSLDQLLMQGAFGTEGHNDPRGDRRN